MGFDQDGEQYQRRIEDAQTGKENIGHCRFTKVKGEQGGLKTHQDEEKRVTFNQFRSKQSTV